MLLEFFRQTWIFFPREAKGHSIFQSQSFGLLRNSSGVPASACTSPRELIVDISPQLVFNDNTSVA